MPSITIRNVPEEIHRRLRVRAARNGRSMEAELRQVLAIAAGLARSPGDAARPAAGASAPSAVIEQPGAPVPPEVLLKLRDILKVRDRTSLDEAGDKNAA